MKKLLLFYVGLSVCLIFSSCSKSITDPSDPRYINTAAPIDDPSNWEPSVVQTNTNAKQYNYGRVRIIKGLSLALRGMNASDISINNIHVYLKSSNGTYLHIPSTSHLGISYGYYLKSASPNSTLYITRSAGAAENYEDIVILSAKTSYLQTLNPAINFTVYGNAKTKLGF